MKPLLTLLLPATASAHEGHDHAVTLTPEQAEAVKAKLNAAIDAMVPAPPPVDPPPPVGPPPVVPPPPTPPTGGLPHPDDPAKQAEHLAMLALVTPQSASLYVPKGETVTLENQNAYHTIRVDGTLVIRGSLRTDTIVCDAGSRLEVHAGARITFTDTGPITDPYMLGRGLISHGTVRILGTFVPANRERALAWKPGDVPTFERSIVFESEATEPSRRGHVMFMHSRDVLVQGALFHRIGRMDKRRIATDPDGQGNGRDNVRGRYAVHFHRAGGGKNDAPAVMRGCAVVDNPGWGVVNHSSHVLVEDCESYNVAGAHFCTEFGDELGAFRRCIAIYSNGLAGNVDNDRGIEDWGFGGHGFWIQGGGTVALEDCIATGHTDGAFVHMGLNTYWRFPVKNLPDGLSFPLPEHAWMTRLLTDMHSHDVPVRMKGCHAKHSTFSYIPWAVHAIGESYHNYMSLVEDCVFENRVLLGYPNKFHFRNVQFLDGIGHTGATENYIFENCRVDGDWQLPTAGVTKVIGGSIGGTARVQNTPWKVRKIHFDGTQTLGPNAKLALSMSHVWYDASILATRTTHDDAARIFYDPWGSFGTDEVKWGGKYLYPNEQKDFDFTPWTSLNVEHRKPLAQLEAKGIFVRKQQLPASARREPWVDGWVADEAAVEK